MSAAKGTVHGLGVLAYVVVVAAILFQNLPIDRLMADPPVLLLGGATLLLFAYIAGVEIVVARVTESGS